MSITYYFITDSQNNGCCFNSSEGSISPLITNTLSSQEISISLFFISENYQSYTTILSTN